MSRGRALGARVARLERSARGRCAVCGGAGRLLVTIEGATPDAPGCRACGAAVRLEIVERRAAPAGGPA